MSSGTEQSRVESRAEQSSHQKRSIQKAMTCSMPCHVIFSSSDFYGKKSLESNSIELISSGVEVVVGSYPYVIYWRWLETFHRYVKKQMQYVTFKPVSMCAKLMRVTPNPQKIVAQTVSEKNVYILCTHTCVCIIISHMCVCMYVFLVMILSCGCHLKT
jgi:hypothetical protein